MFGKDKEDRLREAMKASAGVSTLLLGVVNMAWQQRIAAAAEANRMPFDRPRDLSLFVENTKALCAGILMQDKDLTIGVLKAMGLDKMASDFAGGPWPDEPIVKVEGLDLGELLAADVEAGLRRMTGDS